MIMYTCGEEYTDSGKAIEIDNSDGLKRITSLVADFPLMQEGEGTPSAENIRPFVVWKNINVSDSIATLYDADVNLVAGSLDVFENELTKTYEYIESYNGETLTEPWMSDRDVYAEGTTPSIGAFVVYPSSSVTTIAPNVYSRTLSEGVVTVTSNLTGGYVEEHSYSGDIVSFETENEETLTHLIVSIEPLQDLSNGQPSPDNIVPISGWDRIGIYNNVKRYGVKWDGVNNICTERLFDASGITLDTTNFCNHGTINPNYNNPFDSIYPWSEMKQCNVDLTKYRSGNHPLKECITAWYGDSNFVTEGTNEIFVGRYRPEFWHTRYADEDGNIYWVVAESEVNGYIHAKEAIDGIGFAVDDGYNGVTCGDGQPMTNIAVNQIQARARTSGMELQNIYSIDAQIILYLVEYGNMNIQRALGDGCSNLYRQNANDIISAVNGNTITIPSGGEEMLTKGATLDVGASSGAVVLADRREVQGFVTDGGNLVVTLDEPLGASAVGKYVSIHGSTNADLISDRSGYIGVNTKANVNYRGAILYANRWNYILGIYRQSGTNHIWLCDEDECINYNALNVSVHHDTGRALPALTAAAWLTVGKLNFMQGVSAYAPIRESGGNSVSPIGDQQYVPLPTASNTVLLFGGPSYYGWLCGAFCGAWDYSSGTYAWYHSACPLLK